MGHGLREHADVAREQGKGTLSQENVFREGTNKSFQENMPSGKGSSYLSLPGGYLLVPSRKVNFFGECLLGFTFLTIAIESPSYLWNFSTPPF